MPAPPVPSPRHPAPSDDEPGTDPSIPVRPDYVNQKIASALEQARLSSWRAGWAAGIGCVLVLCGVLFGGWFKIGDAIAQGKSEAVRDAGADTDKKLAPIVTDLAVMNTKVDRLTEDVADLKKGQQTQTEQNAEIIRLLKRKGQ